MRGVFRSISLVVSTCAALAAADLAVTRVALYKHGVGFYERAGEIAAGEPARLEFKASEMDDVLKSLTLVQEGGDGVAAVRYDSADPLEKRLETVRGILAQLAPYYGLPAPPPPAPTER